MNHLLYLAHGHQGYINECRFSLLKFLQVYNLQPPSNLTLVLYTDRPQDFEVFLPFFKAVRFETVDKDRLAQWMAGTGYVHRAKTEMIRHAAQTYGGNVLFMDTDTYITAPIEEIWQGLSEGAVYFHLPEGRLDRRQSRVFHKWDRFLESADIHYGSQRFVYDKNMTVWNSGVLGLSPQHQPLLSEVLQLIDAIHQQFPKHITEQVAASYVFGKATALRPAQHLVAHYWNLKEFRSLLDHFFAQNAEDSVPLLVKKVQPIDALRILQQKTTFDALPAVERWWKRLRGKGWRIEQYERWV